MMTTTMTMEVVSWLIRLFGKMLEVNIEVTREFKIVLSNRMVYYATIK